LGSGGRRKKVHERQNLSSTGNYAEINAVMPCLDNIAMPGMNFVFSIRSLLTAKTISLLLIIVVPLYWPLIG
jgi:hypothetical protein